MLCSLSPNMHAACEHTARAFPKPINHGSHGSTRIKAALIRVNPCDPWLRLIPEVWLRLRRAEPLWFTSAGLVQSAVAADVRRLERGESRPPASLPRLLRRFANFYCTLPAQSFDFAWTTTVSKMEIVRGNRGDLSCFHFGNNQRRQKERLWWTAQSPDSDGSA